MHIMLLYNVKNTKGGDVDMKKRNIAACIIFSIITCGIYGMVWQVNLADDVNRLNTKYKDNMSGLTVLLLTLITCGIYGMYWSYVTGNTLDEIKKEKGIYANNSGILYLIIYILTGGIVTHAIIQNELNNYIEMT